MRSAINSLYIENFKCFKKLEVHFGALTVFCGLNGAGKSSTIQPFLLLAQALRSNQLSLNGTSIGWPLNGELVRLGTCGNVKNEHTPDAIIKFDFKFSDKKSFCFRLEAVKADRKLGNNDLIKKDFPHELFGAISISSFVSASRGDIMDTYPFPDESKYPYIGVGNKGEFACFCYNNNVDKEIETSRCFPGIESREFRNQLDAWLNWITPGASVSVHKLSDTPALALKFRLSETGQWNTPENVGLGLTYVFPILVSLLNANSGDLLIIDSPESHLHPQAQSRVGQMLSLFASTGIQTIVETHSDHVLNGIRLGVKKEMLDPKDLSILFFSGFSENNHGVICLSIDKNGSISEWPSGFFDQSDIDLLELLE